MSKSAFQFAGGQPVPEEKPSRELDGPRSRVQFIEEQPPLGTDQRKPRFRSSFEDESRTQKLVQFVGVPPLQDGRNAQEELSQEWSSRAALRWGELHGINEESGRLSSGSNLYSPGNSSSPSQFNGGVGIDTTSLTVPVMHGHSKFAAATTAATQITPAPSSESGLMSQGLPAPNRQPSRDLQIRVIQAELHSIRVDTEKTLAAKLFGRGTKTEAVIFALAAKSERSMRMLWFLWLVGASVGMLAMSDVLPRALISASVLMLPLPCLTSLVLLIDLVLQVALLFDCYLMTAMQCCMLGYSALLLKDERLIFWACLAPTFLMATFVDAYPSKYRPRFAQLFFLGSGAVLMIWVTMISFGLLDPIHNSTEKYWQLEANTARSTVQLAGTLLAYCGRYLYSAYRTPDSFVVIMSAVSTEKIWVKLERQEVNGKLYPTGKVVRCEKRSTKLDIAPQDMGMTHWTTISANPHLQKRAPTRPLEQRWSHLPSALSYKEAASSQTAKMDLDSVRRRIRLVLDESHDSGRLQKIVAEQAKEAEAHGRQSDQSQDKKLRAIEELLDHGRQSADDNVPSGDQVQTPKIETPKSFFSGLEPSNIIATGNVLAEALRANTTNLTNSLGSALHTVNANLNSALHTVNPFADNSRLNPFADRSRKPAKNPGEGAPVGKAASEPAIRTTRSSDFKAENSEAETVIDSSASMSEEKARKRAKYESQASRGFSSTISTARPSSLSGHGEPPGGAPEVPIASIHSMRTFASRMHLLSMQVRQPPAPDSPVYRPTEPV